MSIPTTIDERTLVILASLLCIVASIIIGLTISNAPFLECWLHPVILDPPRIRARAYAGDGTPVYYKYRIAVRASIRNFSKGFCPSIIDDRVREAINSTIGNIKTAEEIVTNPNFISREVYEMKLDRDSACTIISISIIDIIT